MHKIVKKMQNSFPRRALLSLRSEIARPRVLITIEKSMRRSSSKRVPAHFFSPPSAFSSQPQSHSQSADACTCAVAPIPSPSRCHLQSISQRTNIDPPPFSPPSIGPAQ
jgi:hypothetical protein